MSLGSMCLSSSLHAQSLTLHPRPTHHTPDTLHPAPYTLNARATGPCLSSSLPVPCGDRTCRSTFVECLAALMQQVPQPLYKLYQPIPYLALKPSFLLFAKLVMWALMPRLPHGAGRRYPHNNTHTHTHNAQTHLTSRRVAGGSEQTRCPTARHTVRRRDSVARDHQQAVTVWGGANRNRGRESCD